MGLIGKTLGGLINRFKNNISQGVQGAKRLGGNMWNTAKQGLINSKDFIYNNREHIGGALKAISPFIGAINPMLGYNAYHGGSWLQEMSPGPVKDKLEKLTNQTDDMGLASGTKSNGGNRSRYERTLPSKSWTTVESGAQEALNRKRKRAKLMTQL